MHTAYIPGEINYKRTTDPPGILLDPSAIFSLYTKIDVAASKRDETQAVEPFIQILSDEVADVRKAAIVALGKIGDTQAIRPPAKALKDRDRDVRTTAKVAFEKLNIRRI
jgi:HEAT repeat protein